MRKSLIINTYYSKGKTIGNEYIYIYMYMITVILRENIV